MRTLAPHEESVGGVPAGLAQAGEGIAKLLAQGVQGLAQAVEVGRQQAARGDERARKMTHGMPPLVPGGQATPGG